MFSADPPTPASAAHRASTAATYSPPTRPGRVGARRPRSPRTRPYEKRQPIASMRGSPRSPDRPEASSGARAVYSRPPLARPSQPGRAAATLRRAASSAPAPHRISTRRQSNAARRTVGHIRVAGTSEAPNSPPPATRSRPGDRAVSRRGGRPVQGAPKPASGASMRNISMVRSGSTSAWLRNAST